jgi:hypothetical protein
LAFSIISFIPGSDPLKSIGFNPRNRFRLFRGNSVFRTVIHSGAAHILHECDRTAGTQFIPVQSREE